MRPEIRDILASVSRPFRYAGGEAGSRPKAWDGASVRLCLAFPEIYEMGMSHLGLAILYHLVNDREGWLAERAFAPWEDMEAELSRRGMPLFSLESHRPLAHFDVVGFSLPSELTWTNVLMMLDLAGIPLRAADRLDRQTRDVKTRYETRDTRRETEPPLTLSLSPEGRGISVPSPFRGEGQGEGGVLSRDSSLESRVSSLESSFPLIIAGGASAFNPMPMAAFFDAIVIGDGEGAIVRILEAVEERKRRGFSKRALIEGIAEFPGIFVPLLHGGSRPVGRARVPDLEAAPFPRRPVVPHAATQERLAVEAARGCSRGCRFCQAGFITRPVRQRSGALAAELAGESLACSGAEEFSFLSLSIGDWAPIEGALAAVQRGLAPMPVFATLPSLRAESLTDGVLSALGSARAGSFTFAPEAATERMRRFINKGNTDEDLYASVERAFAKGWHAVKLYFMAGLPGETELEIEGICRMANRCLEIGRCHHRRPEVTVSTSTFVPKAHTPFQWERQIGIEEALAIQRQLKRRLRRPGLSYRWHGAEMSFLEGVFSRGGAELSWAIELAYVKGARFDGWDERFDLARWREAFAEAGIVSERYFEARGQDEPFPWDSLGCGPDREFLWRERERAFALIETTDCARGSCARCGMCDFEEVRHRIAAVETANAGQARQARHEESDAGRETSETGGAGETMNDVSRVSCVTGVSRVYRYRLRYTKAGRAAFLGGIETLDALRRALRASGLPLVYSEGFHPRPRIAVGPALPVGVESEAEFVDVALSAEMDGSEIVQRMAGRLPEGMEVVEAALLPEWAHSIEEDWLLARYEADCSALSFDLDAICRKFAEVHGWTVSRVRGEKAQELDLKDVVQELAQLSQAVLGVALRNLKPTLRVGEILAALTGAHEAELKRIAVRKRGVVWREEARCPTN